ncbi:hypothetical protein C5F48_22515 [Cereibacter changlensis JA139]|uniref:Peptidase S24/S26A/S26B/S26C domain-containing protein n=3 Tax=Cereibacter changlensis TaxID=402884 RepID=A0A2T4JNQ4_9RHOB|nr:S24 family peptidase [Cereibacter changlensis]PTE19516.1 hypothetical protein C5F48_22515 [Cereibacter changlensis JA139]PZX47744.1 phage repressor protein C with HTH and peptisase S24 domain [Cereibacter changlensis]
MPANPLKTQETSDRIRDLVNAALKEKGMSGRQASLAVVGHDGLIRDIRAGRLPGLDKLLPLFDLLGLESYFGPPRETGVVEQVILDGADFSQIPLHEAYLAAGDGHLNGDAPVVGQLAFRKDWLKKIGVSPSKAVLARVHGDSMQPTMQPDDLVMIDRARNTVPVRARTANDRRPATIYALLHEGHARIKRIERPEEGLMMLVSDNPAYGPEILTGSRIEALNIIGKVMWWGHTNRE